VNDSDYAQYFSRRGTQSEFGVLVGISQQAVSAHIASGVLTAGATLIEWLRDYCYQLRREAAKHNTGDGSDLTRERVLTERVDRELKLMALHEKARHLVPADEVKPAMQAIVSRAKAELSAMTDKICMDIQALYGIDLNDDLVHKHVEEALKHLAEYESDGIA